MSQSTERIDRTIKFLQELLELVDCGTADRPRKVPRVDLARERLRDFAPITPPPNQVGPPRGGSSTSRDGEDRAEARNLDAQVLADIDRLPLVLAEIDVAAGGIVKNLAAADRLADEAQMIVSRYIKPIDTSQLPTDAAVPGCVSCARPQRPGAAGHFQPVADPDPHGPKRWGMRITASLEKLALCRFCRTHAVANALEAGDVEVGRRHLPELRAVDILNRETEQAAGRWLAQERARTQGRKRSA